MAHASPRPARFCRRSDPGFRALFADDIAAELTFPGGDKAETETFVGQVSKHIALFLVFARAALPAYAAELPDEAWKDWLRDER